MTKLIKCNYCDHKMFPKNAHHIKGKSYHKECAELIKSLNKTIRSRKSK